VSGGQIDAKDMVHDGLTADKLFVATFPANALLLEPRIVSEQVVGVRWVERDGQRVLQFARHWQEGFRAGGIQWDDVPLEVVQPQATSYTTVKLYVTGHLYLVDIVVDATVRTLASLGLAAAKVRDFEDLSAWSMTRGDGTECAWDARVSSIVDVHQLFLARRAGVGG
jgi:hypothetical protein